MRNAPHIGATVAQSRIMRTMLDREIAAEKARFDAIHAELTVDELMSRFRQHDEGGCDTSESPAVHPAIFWPVVVAFSLLMTFAFSAAAYYIIPILRNLP